MTDQTQVMVESKPPPRWARIWDAPPWWKAAMVGDLAVCAWLLTAPEKTRHMKLAAIACLSVISFVTSWALFEASRREGLNRQVRRGLAFIASGIALAGLGASYLFVDASLNLNYNSIFSLADAFSLLSYPLVLIGLFSLPSAGLMAAGRWRRILLDGAAFVIGVGMPLWQGAVGPAWRLNAGIDAVLIVLWPAIALIGLFCLNAALLTRAPVPGRNALWFLISGIGVSWLADLVFSLDSAALIIRASPIHWVNLTNAVSLGLCLLAARGYRADAGAKNHEMRPAPFSPIPMVAMTIVAGLLIIVSLHNTADPQMLRSILPGLVVLFLILLVREVFGSLDTVRWMGIEYQRESELRVVAMVRYSSDILMVIDSQLTIQFASPSLASNLNYADDQMLGRSLMQFVHPDDIRKGGDFFSGLVALPKGVSKIIWRIRKSDGSYRNFETAGSNALGESAVAGFVLNSRDVTDRIHLEQEMLQSQKLGAIGRLVGGIAHNFNNILTPIIGYSDILRESKELPKEFSESLEVLKKGSRRTADLIKQLLYFGQLQYLDRKRFNLLQELASLRPKLEGMMRAGVKLIITGSAESSWVWADRALVCKVVENLCANAIEAMPAGGRLTIGVVRDAVQAESSGTSGAKQYVCLFVEDTGKGMPESVQQNLFEPFFTTKEVGLGLGLGLAVVHGIANQHGGWVRVDTQIGRGSTFRVFLPAEAESEEKIVANR